MKSPPGSSLKREPPLSVDPGKHAERASHRQMVPQVDGDAMAATAVTSLPETCPLCHGPLESGVLLAPRGIYWADRTHWSILGAETVISMWASLKMPNLSAVRCRSCGLGLFSWQSASEPRPQGSGFRFACPGCAADVYAGERTCPSCGTRLPDLSPARH